MTEKRISDTNFAIESSDSAGNPLGNLFRIEDGAIRKQYIIECESKPVSGRILVRIAEYAMKAGIEAGTGARSGELKIWIPRTAAVSLRSTENTPESLRLVLETEEGQIGTTVPVIRLSDYTIDAIFEKKLYLLIPFFLFVYEKQFREIEEDERACQMFLDEVRTVFQTVDALIPAEEDTFSLMDMFTSKALRAMTHTVVNGLAEHYPKIREGVNTIVGGNILEFDALRIKREGAAEERTTVAERMIHDGLSGDKISLFTQLERKDIDKIAKRIHRSVSWNKAIEA